MLLPASRLAAPIFHQTLQTARQLVTSSPSQFYLPRCHHALEALRPRYSSTATPSNRNPADVHRSFSGVEFNVSALMDKETKPVSPEEQWRRNAATARETLARISPANPYTGRTVKVTKNVPVANANKLLDNIMSRNKIRAQLWLTQRHEKRGAKRRRLSSERWRRQFANEVRKKVQLVVQIRNRGA